MEDNGGLRRLLMDVIGSESNFTTDGAGSVAEAEALISDPTTDYSAILLDLSLPDGDGRSFCRSLRDRGIQVPILILSGASGPHEIAFAMECGASVYLTKPIRMGEFMNQLRSALQHAAASPKAPSSHHFAPAALQC